ncbi:M67 family metallopeptidase [Tsuneonella suprasediminis]|uniref:M67 family metallopeptidase n=1 Tax=Tsuneonella suprasediminis TaxID=2306996 RepID=UPI002F92FA4F
MGITTSGDLYDRMIRLAAEAHPNEACGLLLGEGAHVHTIVATVNVHPSPATHFEIDPQALIDVHRAARAGGPDVVGYFHSHPHGPPAPSATDAAMASGDGRVWAIFGQGQVRWWRDLPDGFAAVDCRIG